MDVTENIHFSNSISMTYERYSQDTVNSLIMRRLAIRQSRFLHLPPWILHSPGNIGTRLQIFSRFVIWTHCFLNHAAWIHTLDPNMDLIRKVSQIFATYENKERKQKASCWYSFSFYLTYFTPYCQYVCSVL